MIRELVLVYKILKWHGKTFPCLPMEAQKRKLNNEINEFIDAKEKYTRSRRYKQKNEMELLEEMSDVIIAGINCLKYPDFYERVAVKHAKNTHRTWNGIQHKGEKE